MDWIRANPTRARTPAHTAAIVAAASGLLWAAAGAFGSPSGAATTEVPSPPVTAAAPLAAAYATARDAGRPLDRTLPAAEDPAWPLRAFLLAQALRLRGELDGARGVEREMVQWCGGDPWRDGSGASALCAFALWRVVAEAAADTEASAAERRARLDSALRAWQAGGPLAQGLYGAPAILGGLPQLREDTLRQLLALAWQTGDRAAAHRLLREYLGVAREATLTPPEQDVLADGVAARALDRERLFLALGKRLAARGQSSVAHDLFEQARRSSVPVVAADARLQLAQELRDADGRACATPELSAEVQAVIDATADAELRQRALLLRARRHLRRGCPIDVAGFEADLNRLRAEYPRASTTFTAASELASFQLDRYFARGDVADLEQALRRFAQARELAVEDGAIAAARAPEPLAQAWFKPALALLARNGNGDVAHATALLRELDTRSPQGPLRLATRFWLGRLDAEAGRLDDARAQWQRVIADSPFDYHALRARLWLALGPPARSLDQPDPETRKALAAATLASRRGDGGAATATPQAQRLAAALAQGVYGSAVATFDALRRTALPGRPLEDVPMSVLAESRRLTEVAVALALRQDAMLAAERAASTAQRLQIATSVAAWPAATAGGGPGGNPGGTPSGDPSGAPTGDWPLAVVLSAPRGAPSAAGNALQQDPRFLAAAYPDAYLDLIGAAAARWKVAPELLYAVMRTETIFNPSTESNRAALGLFQFIPPTFRELNTRWRLVDGNDPAAVEAFLLTPASNIDLGARWFAQDLLPRQRGHVPWALMSHNAGPGAVANWKTMWQRLGRSDDLDFMVDTVPYDETRGFIKRALSAMWLADPAGIRWKRSPAEGAPSR